jgi:hypothetical protein
VKLTLGTLTTNVAVSVIEQWEHHSGAALNPNSAFQIRRAVVLDTRRDPHAPSRGSELGSIAALTVADGPLLSR